MSTSTSTQKIGRNGQRKDATEPAPATAGEALAPPPKLRRRPVLIAASVAAICLGALASVWAYTSTSTTREVLAVRQTIDRGATITREDLMVVQLSVDPALHPLPGSALGTVVGQHAALDMPAGLPVTQDQVTDTAVPEKGASVVGISLAAAMLPAGQLRVGDPVRVVTTPGQAGDIGTEPPDAVSATVVGVSTDPATGNTVVNVEVPFEKAPDVAARAATGKVALVLDSSER